MGDLEGRLKTIKSYMEGIEKGFKGLTQKLDKLHHEDAFHIFMEAVDRIIQVEELLLQQEKKDDPKLQDVPLSDARLADAINHVVVSYQEGDMNALKRNLEKDVIPEFQKFKTEIENRVMIVKVV